MCNSPISGYKMTNSDMQCRGFQYEMRKEFECDTDVVICESGFHFCTDLFSCFNYYGANINDRLFIVNGWGESECGLDKIATEFIEFKTEILPLSEAMNELIKKIPEYGYYQFYINYVNLILWLAVRGNEYTPRVTEWLSEVSSLRLLNAIDIYNGKFSEAFIKYLHDYNKEAYGYYIKVTGSPDIYDSVKIEA